MPSLVEIGPVVLEKKFFFNFVDLFSLLSPLGKGRGHASKQTYPRMLCAKFDGNWSSGSGEEDFLLSSIYFCYFVIFYP